MIMRNERSVRGRVNGLRENWDHLIHEALRCLRLVLYGNVGATGVVHRRRARLEADVLQLRGRLSDDRD